MRSHLRRKLELGRCELRGLSSGAANTYSNKRKRIERSRRVTALPIAPSLHLQNRADTSSNLGGSISTG